MLGDTKVGWVIKRGYRGRAGALLGGNRPRLQALGAIGLVINHQKRESLAVTGGVGEQKGIPRTNIRSTPSPGGVHVIDGGDRGTTGGPEDSGRGGRSAGSPAIGRRREGQGGMGGIGQRGREIDFGARTLSIPFLEGRALRVPVAAVGPKSAARDQPPIQGRMAARLGLEPRQTESESVVLPLHHRAGKPFLRGRSHQIPVAGTGHRQARGWSRRWDSNPQPPVYKTGALPLSYAGVDHRPFERGDSNNHSVLANPNPPGRAGGPPFSLAGERKMVAPRGLEPRTR
jgi:hypothetical protein